MSVDYFTVPERKTLVNEFAEAGHKFVTVGRESSAPA
jgi:hypothetical protein